MLTRTRVAGAALAIVAAGALAAGLPAAMSGGSRPASSAGLAAHSGSSSGRDGHAAGQPTAAGSAMPLSRPAAAASGAAKTRPDGSARPVQSAAAASGPQPSAGPATPAAAAPAAPSYYTIHNKAHNLCLNAMSTADTAQVDVANCNGSWYQDWAGITAGSAVPIVNKESSLCLTAKSVASGADVVIATCHGYRNQVWVASGARLYLEALSASLCLTGDSAATNESPAGAQACTAAANQQWTW